MNPQKTAPPQSHSAKHTPARQPTATHPGALRVAQPKTSANIPHMRQQPIAPPAYRPQMATKVLQPKMASAAHAPMVQKAPPVYRPHPTPKVLQAKKALNGGVSQPPVANAPAPLLATRPNAPRVVRGAERPGTLPPTAVLSTRPAIIQRSSSQSSGSGRIAEHNWDKVICGYAPGTAEKVDSAFRRAGYGDGQSRRRAILQALGSSDDWSHSKIAHASGGKGSGIRGGTPEKIAECAKYLIDWANDNPASGSGGSGGYISKGKQVKKSKGLSEDALGDLYAYAAVNVRKGRDGMTMQQSRKEYVKNTLTKRYGYSSSNAEDIAEQMYPTPLVVPHVPVVALAPPPPQISAPAAIPLPTSFADFARIRRILDGDDAPDDAPDDDNDDF